MRIWVDADACPGEVKSLLFRTAERRKVRVTLVSNQSIWIPSSEYIDCVVVASGANVADRKIASEVQPGDLVVTADVPLAADVVGRGAQALNPRGELYTESNIGERAAVRDLHDQLRGAGLVAGGPANYSARDRQEFANQLDRWLTARERRSGR